MKALKKRLTGRNLNKKARNTKTIKSIQKFILPGKRLKWMRFSLRLFRKLTYETKSWVKIS